MKVLILAYDFPPLISIGAQRPYSWYKYLPDDGLQVTVVTRHWSEKITSPSDYVKPTVQGTTINREGGNKTIRRVDFNPNLRDRILLKYGLSKFSLFRKLLSFLYPFLEHWFLTFDSKAAIYFEAVKAIEYFKPDVIIATGEPFILFKYGHRLSDKFGIPWIADYRDGWTTNQGNYSQGLLSRLQSRFFKIREQKYVQNAMAVTTASPTYATELAKIHPGKKVKVIYNGYDEEFFKNQDTIQPPVGKFVISYAGTIYPHQNLELFLDGFNKFVIDEKLQADEVALKFFGLQAQPSAKQRLMDYKPMLNAFIEIEPRVPYGYLIEHLRASHLLLLLSKNGANWLNAKIFDYLGVRRKILLVENDHGIMENMLHETGGGVALDSVDGICAFLKQEYKNFKAGSIAETGTTEVIRRYTRKNQAIALSDFLKKELGKPGHSL